MENSRKIDLHNHLDTSNLRLIDSINTIDSLAKRAIDIGLKGIVFTDHECLSASIKICEARERYPELKLGIGNEIYLTEDRSTKQSYYHFLLIAKDPIGHKQLRILSSRAWLQSYVDRRMERVPTLKRELEEVVSKNPGHLIATTACLAGEISQNILRLEKARLEGNSKEEALSYQKIVDFVSWCKKLFGEDFYIELPPGASKEQIIANKKLYQIAKIFNVKVETSCDAHYPSPKEREIHSAFLRSKNGERETDSFYHYSYLQDESDILKHLRASYGEETENIYKECCDSASEIFDKIEEYNLFHNQTIPKIDIPVYEKINITDKRMDKYPILKSMFNSDDNSERYWVRESTHSLANKIGDLFEHPEYLEELEKEADIKRTVGKNLGTNMFNYPITLKHYIDLIWDCGSTLGSGRGSAGAGLNHYALGITQTDPVALKEPFERYMNKDTKGLGDIDIDLCPSVRPKIIQKIKKERGQKFLPEIDDLSRKHLGATLIATFGTASSRRAIQIACKGYRSETCPDGIDDDTAKYFSSLIPSERGFTYPIRDVYYGNESKGRKRVATFVKEIDQYPGLLDIILGVEGLIVSRGSHASGVIFQDEDPYKFGCYMKTPRGDVITQYDLEDAERAGLTKYDFLLTSIQDKFKVTLKLLQEYGEIESDLSLREAYDKYLAPEVLPLENKEVWDNICRGKILDFFQFDSAVGSQGIKQVQPRNINDLAYTNGVIRLMAEDGKERPLDKYVRYKNDISLWYKEMENEGLTKEEQHVMERYLLESYGVGISQEQIMWSLMDKDICGFSLKEANAARKIISKKKMDKLPELKEKIMATATSKAIGEYEWNYIVMPSAGYGFSIVMVLTHLTCSSQG